MSIDFISAEDGKIVLYSNKKILQRSNKTEELAKSIAEFGIKDCIVSSSVEFSSEFGFADDNAMEIVEIAIEKAKEK
tara:strand:+ start:293 stop:523 length:231 start_codon:yes stop_codon:yes gene_type:complete